MASLVKRFLLASLFFASFSCGNGFNITDYELGATRINNDFIPSTTIDLESFVAGPGLETISNYILQKEGFACSRLSTPRIMSKILTALHKNDSERSPSERLCLKTINFSINKLASSLIPYFQKHPGPHHRLVIFGGVVLGAGPLYQMLLQQRINKLLLKSKTSVDVFVSPLGDERAIIGSVAYTSQLENPKPYAIGIDLGGTRIRAAKVNLESLTISGKIITCNSLSCDYNIQAMRYLSNAIKTNTRALDLANLPPTLHIDTILSTKDALLHTNLTEDLLNQICGLLSNFDLTDVAFISIASPGINDEKTGWVKLAYNVPLTDINLPEEVYNKGLSRDIDIKITSDVGSAGVGELMYGAGQKLPGVFVLGIGTGLNLCYVAKDGLKVDTDSSESADDEDRSWTPFIPRIPSGLLPRCSPRPRQSPTGKDSHPLADFCF